MREFYTKTGTAIRLAAGERQLPLEQLDRKAGLVGQAHRELARAAGQLRQFDVAV